MTRHPPARYVLAALSAAVLTACGGGSPDIDGTAAEAGIASEQGTSDGASIGSPAERTGDSGSDDEAGGAGGAGEQPGRSGDQAGGGGRAGGPDPDGDGGGGARPGGPFDVEAFEQIGQEAEQFLPVGRAQCSGGRCTLVEQTFEDPERQVCEVADFAYDPPARPEDAPPSDQFIQRGTIVTVVIACPPEDAGAPGGESEGSESEGTDTGGTDTGGTDTGGTDTGDTDTDTGGSDTGGTDTEGGPAEEPAG
jgi:hypothetical protein